MVGETGIHSLVSLRNAMTQAENPYRQEVFLEDLRQQKNRQQQRIWAEHQQMQLSFLQRHGLKSSSTVLDIGCGPLRLGSALIPLLETAGITDRTSTPTRSPLAKRCCARQVFLKRRPTPCFASDQFRAQPGRSACADCFANSVFSHLTLNSTFTALLQLQNVLAPSGVLYATFFALEPGRQWLQPHPRNKWGREFETYPHQDPYHYPIPMLQNLARQAGFRLDLMDDFGHPTQTMGRFRGQGGSAGSLICVLVLWQLLRDEISLAPFF